jgi:fermentation-respiration switch protein FrsA (DUF1100 family)
MRGVLSLLLVLAGSAPLFAQAAPESTTFKITQTNPVVSTSTISGKEGYKISATAEGYTISSHLWVAEGETPVLSAIEEHLGPDWSLRSYAFDATVGGIKQKFEARVDGGKVKMQVTGEQMNPQRTVDVSANMVVLDNFVPSNFQVLLNEFSAASGHTPRVNPEDVLLLVPQRLLALKGKISRNGVDTGHFDGKQIPVNKFLLQAPGVTAEIWANAKNQLLGVYFAQPDIEYLQDHFDLPQLTLATKKKLPTERPVSFMSHGRRLLGTFMLPPESLGKREKYPVVILVAGFGPLDRDETVGRCKPLRDIAIGLANAGIASLRYDKPTYSFHGKLDSASLTIDEETVDAAVAAAGLVQTLPEADTANVFLLGHSEGAEMAPFIIKKAGAIQGAILMAAPGRAPEEFVPEQLAAGLKMRGLPEEKIELRVRECREQLTAIHQGKQGSATVLNMSAGFWRSLMQHDNLAALRDINVPVLVLQGDRDAQVSKKDFDLVTAAVPADKLDREYFSGLDHIFAPAPEGGNESEILIGSHVAGEVIQRITDWVEKHTSTSDVKVASRTK